MASTKQSPEHALIEKLEAKIADLEGELDKLKRGHGSKNRDSDHMRDNIQALAEIFTDLPLAMLNEGSKVAQGMIMAGSESIQTVSDNVQDIIDEARKDDGSMSEVIEKSVERSKESIHSFVKVFYKNYKEAGEEHA